jgi:DNA-binding GntR family transcriptional regulator
MKSKATRKTVSGAVRAAGKATKRTAAAATVSATRKQLLLAERAGTRNVDGRIYESIFNAVMSHRLPPGTKITEQSLCELFRVSRTIVRKVLQRLAHEQIIDLRLNRGATVASPTPQETHEIFAARRVVEAAIVPLVVAQATPPQLARLRKHIRSEHAALDAGDRSTWIRLTGEFHLELAEVAGNRILARFLSQLVSRCSLIIALYDSPISVPCADGEHEQLLEVIAARDAARALKLMDQHLLAIEQRLQLDERTDAIDLAEILTYA